MKTEIPFLKLDTKSPAVLNAAEEFSHGPIFPTRMLMALTTESVVTKFLEHYPHHKLDQYLTISCSPNIYEVEIEGRKIGLCQTPLGAPAAVQLEEFLIAGGARRILASGSCGIISSLKTNAFFVPVKALRDEGTSFHYLPISRYIKIDKQMIAELEEGLVDLGVKYQEITTWTTDAFFRETESKINEFVNEGVSTVEMECAGLAACAKFRKVHFAQILFTADSLTGLKHDRRDWGSELHPQAIELAAHCLAKMKI